MKSAYPSASVRMTFILVFLPAFSSSLFVPTPVNIPMTSTEKGKRKKEKLTKSYTKKERKITKIYLLTK